METFEEMRLDLRGLQSDGSWATDTGPKRMEAAACTKLRDAVKTFTAPKRGHWVKSLEKLALLLASPPRLVDLLEIGPVRKLALNEGKYDGADIPAAFAREFSPWAQKAREEMVRIHQLRESALVALATKYDRARGAQSYSSGSYTFREVEAAALQVAGGLDSEELYFRLDGRIAHLLLDEFQDTSRRQFSFFKPVLEETTGKGGHVLVVGDRKQSIYGWRGSDPRLLLDVEKVLPGVKRELLSESFRSSRAVLAAVDRAFVGLPESELFHQKGKEKPVFAAAAAEWREDYQSHKSSPQAASQSGKVVLYVTPGSCSDEVKTAVRKQVVQLAKTHVENQKGSLGILCRTHKLIPGILAGLKSHGIEASGEGGNPLTDSGAVEMILSLLSWADHPGHSAGRYHVCAGGMAEIFGCERVPAKISGEETEAREFLNELRRKICDHGLAEVISGWVTSKEWREAGTAHDRMRCSQLVESARAFDEGGGGRLAEFVRRVRAERVENPRAAQVRVMTVHGAKGLEFDRVILADLDRGLSAGGMDKVKVRVLEEENRAVILPSEEDAGFLGMGELVDKVKGEEFMEALSVLYVGLTRAKRDLEVVVGGPRKKENLNLGKILRSQWGWSEAQAEGELEVVDSKAEKFSGPKKAAVPADPGVAEKVGTAPRKPEVRLELESPSAREGGGKVRLAHVIAQSSGKALDRGTRIHSWLSRIEWHDGKGSEAKRWVEEAPELWWGVEEAEVRREALEVAQQVEKGMKWVFDRKDWEKRWADVAKLEVWREKSFAVVWEREGKGQVLSGTFDRVVVARDGKGKAVAAEVVDFKTDQLKGEKEKMERAEYYRASVGGVCGGCVEVDGTRQGKGNHPDRVGMERPLA